MAYRLSPGADSRTGHHRITSWSTTGEGQGHWLLLGNRLDPRGFLALGPAWYSDYQPQEPPPGED